MLEVLVYGRALGADVINLDLSKPLSGAVRRLVPRALADHRVLRFPGQTLTPGELKAFSANFGGLEVNVAGSFQEPGLPEVMTLSNMVVDGRPIGFRDAGQDWHTDLSYSRTIAWASVLYALKVPRADGRPLGATRFADMHAAYRELPEELKVRLAEATATHDYAKLWDRMRRRPGSRRPPLTEAQRRRKPPVSHPVFLTHPITGLKVLYANPGYTVAIDGLPAAESAEILEFLFAHQVQDRYIYSHEWQEGDVLLWDDIATVHMAVADYGPEQPRLMQRCQVMADRIFGDGPR